MIQLTPEEVASLQRAIEMIANGDATRIELKLDGQREAIAYDMKNGIVRVDLRVR